MGIRISLELPILTIRVFVAIVITVQLRRPLLATNDAGAHRDFVPARTRSLSGNLKKLPRECDEPAHPRSPLTSSGRT